MRSKVVRMLALALVLSGMSIVLGQQQSAVYPGARQDKEVPLPKGKKMERTVLSKEKGPAPEKSKLEEMLAEALKNNPDIRVAAAKMVEAEAELNRTRLQVTQKVVTQYYAIEAQKKIIEHAEKRDKRAQNLGPAIGIEDKEEIRQTLALAKAKLEELEAQFPALLGKSAHSEAGAAKQRVDAIYGLALKARQDRIELEKYHQASLAVAGSANQHKAAGPMAERLRKTLQTPVKVDYKNITFDAILDDLSKKAPGLPFRRVVSGAPHYSINLRFEEPLPISAILQALEDEFGCSFFVRDYGLVAMPRGQGPHGAMTVEEFLRQKPEDKARPQSRGGKNPPAESVEGVVKSVDGKGLITISIGSDGGLAKGQTLELYWMPHKPPINDARPFGTVRIVEVEAHQSVAEPVGILAHNPQRGDRIIGRIQKSAEKNPPPENVEGLVGSVDASGLMTLTIGSDAGLTKGHTLELFRLNPSEPSQSKYLGTVRILEAEAHQSVAQPVGRLSSPPQRGDRVASRLLGN